MELLTPPLTPATQPQSTVASMTATGSNSYQSQPIRRRSTSPPSGQFKQTPEKSMPTFYSSQNTIWSSPEFMELPPPASSNTIMSMPDLELPGAAMDVDEGANMSKLVVEPLEESADAAKYTWKEGMSPEDRDAREEWLSQKRGRSGLRIVIVTENFLPKVDGVTRTLARLLEHLEKEGHSCMLLGPGSGMSHYASHPLVGTAGVPLVVYPGLKLNFLRPKFMRTIKDFQPDVVHFVDPIWLGAQTSMAMELGWAGEEWVGQGGPALGAGISGAVVASYHTNLATYATLFGMAWLEPIMWRWQRWLYSKTLLTLCPSPSTLSMLNGQSFNPVRLWPRGVELTQFNPLKRCHKMRASWGVGEIIITVPQIQIENNSKALPMGINHTGRKASMPLTPPASPWVLAQNPTNNVEEPTSISSESGSPTLPSRVVLLYVGRISWEKNLLLLLKAYGKLQTHLPEGVMVPKLVFVGDGPAKVELEQQCTTEGWDTVFMGHRSGEELARCYASADIFAFPSFTETFGQVVLEALASGLPVVGLDAEGTRDLVKPNQTGLLLPYPLSTPTSWPSIFRTSTTTIFEECADKYANLLSSLVLNHEKRQEMGKMASTIGIKGFTWWDAMEKCVDGYREAIRIARQKRSISVITHPDLKSSSSSSILNTIPEGPGTSSPSPKFSRVNRALSSSLAHRGKWSTSPSLVPTSTTPSSGTLINGKGICGGVVAKVRKGRIDTAESLWHLKTLLKAAVAIYLFYSIYSRTAGRSVSPSSLMPIDTVREMST